MPYLSLYRKYRPQTFADVMGQEHVVQTLQNALRFGHIANGYLFCGTRGVAKTTIARILAKCLNCLGPDGLQSIPQPEPCNRCSQCAAIQAGQNVDVVELDAASNRSVSDIAKLRESVQFGPMQSRYKVYIVDEAHQLSSDAKDAFLKTLEEPPANVVFVLATTEAHAIPITIASRCQQFDFRRGSMQEIARQCEFVLSAEAVQMPSDAIELVARAADGSYRDALSLLDQVLAYKRDAITASDVAAALGTVESAAIESALSAIAAEDRAALLSLAEEIFLQGKDVRQFFRALGSSLRDKLVEAVATPTARGARPGDDSSAPLILRQIEIVAEAERRTRHSDQHRLLLETTLLKLSFASVAPVPAALPAETASARQIRPAPSPSQRPQPEPPQPSPARQAAPALASAEAPAGSEDEAHEAPFVPDDPDVVLRRLRASWQEVLHHIQVRFPGGAPVVGDATPEAVVGATIVLRFSRQANVTMIEKPARRLAIENVINRVLRVPQGAYTIRAVAAAAPATSAGSAPAATASKPSLIDDDGPTPVLDAVIATFGGRIVEDES